MGSDWSAGDWIVRREVLAACHTPLPWRGARVRVVEDSSDWLVSYIPERAPFGFPKGDWPIPGGRHPWSARTCWEGHGALMLQRPGESHAVFHFWRGPRREFAHWYVNLQEPFRRTAIGYDTQDLELDLVVPPDGCWQLKDDELLDQRVVEGRFNAAQAAAIREECARLPHRLEAGERWWPLEWRDWRPDPDWVVPDALPAGWDEVPAEPGPMAALR